MSILDDFSTFSTSECLNVDLHIDVSDNQVWVVFEEQGFNS